MTTASTRRGSGHTWARFSRWRQTRPFWGSVVAIIGGIEIYLAAAAPLSVVVMQGLPGLLTMAVFLITVVLAGVTLYQPHLRSITGLLILIIGPLSIMATNLGGFVIGMILLVVGGGLILAWAPAEDDLDYEYIAGESDSGSYAADTRSASTAALPPAGPSDPDRSSAEGRTYGGTEYIDPIPSSSLRQVGASGAPKKKRPAPPPRTGLAGVLDTMFGTRKGPAGKKRPAGKRPAGKRPAGQRPSGSGSGTGSLSSLDRPADPSSTANARTWIAIPLILAAMAATTAIAGPATAAQRADGPLDWLFPPATATPTPTPTKSAATPAASATPSPGFTIPSLDDLLNPTPSASPGTQTGDAVAPAAECPTSKDLTGTTAGGQKAIDGAAALQACVNAAEDNGQVTKKDTAAAPKVGSEVSTLKASRMEMEGFAYDGVATVDSPDGPVQTLHFTADSLKVEGMNQTYPFDGGTVSLTNPRSTATLKGNVDLYVTSFKSNVFGLIPLTFTVDGLQPPLVLPSMFFTDATSVIAFVKCDQILIPTLVSTVK